MKTTRLFLALAILLGVLVPGRAAAPQRTAGELFEKALYIEEGQGDLQKAIALYQDIVKKFPAEREIAAKAQLHIGLCYEKLGLAEAQKAFQKAGVGYLIGNEEDKKDAAKRQQATEQELKPLAGTIWAGRQH